MDFDLPADLVAYLAELDAFIEAKIKPLQAQDDNERFFDHRREHARTDWDNNGLPARSGRSCWPRRASWPTTPGTCAMRGRRRWAARAARQLAMAVIREHLAAKGLGLFNDLQTEHSIVGNNPFILMFKEFATNAQYERDGDKLLGGKMRTGFGLLGTRTRTWTLCAKRSASWTGGCCERHLLSALLSTAARAEPLACSTAGQTRGRGRFRTCDPSLVRRVLSH